MPTPALADPAPTLGLALRRAAERFPSRSLTLFDTRGRRAESRTFPELLSSAQATAARLATLGVEPGDRVMVCLPTSLAWLETWFGALLLGAWPAAFAPSAAVGSATAQLERLDGLLEHLGVRHACCGEAFRARAAEHGARRTVSAAITSEKLASTAPAASVEEARPDPDAVAYLQLTSGSTGRPRAVMVTHRGALHNTCAIDEAIGEPYGAPAGEWADAMVSWLPLHHDMGLVGCVFHALVGGFDLHLLPPRAFLARPRLWLDNLARQGATICPAPNFGYQLCTERISEEERDGLDLSRWRAAMVGAEMIRPETVEAFTRAFERCGLGRGVLRACYGLAEATLAVTVDRRRDGVRTLPAPGGGDADHGERVASVGTPVADTELRVIAPDGTPMPDAQVGEVRVRGPGVSPGYYNDAEATAETLDDGWLRTGDLGFLAAGDLYLTGRLKDVLIIRGENVMPHELEWAAERVVGGGASFRCGAFSVARGAQGEQAVLVVETDAGDPATLAGRDREVRVALGRSLSLPLADLVFVRRGQIPKTTSGKVQRAELRRRYVAGELERLSPTRY